MEDMFAKREKPKPKSYDLIVCYYDGLDTSLDKGIENALKPLGYRFVGSGFDFTEGRRDVEFKVIKQRSK